MYDVYTEPYFNEKLMVVENTRRTTTVTNTVTVLVSSLLLHYLKYREDRFIYLLLFSQGHSKNSCHV